MPSLASLAAELGVSRTTVSNAFNHPDQLSKPLRAKILAAAQAHGYAGPDPMARSLRTQRTGAVGVVLTEELPFAFEDRASVDFLAGLAQIRGYSLTLIPQDGRVHDAIVDGIVVYSVPDNDPQLHEARQRGLPLVVCDQPKDTGVPFVGIDDYAAIQPAAQALAGGVGPGRAAHVHLGARRLARDQQPRRRADPQDRPRPERQHGRAERAGPRLRRHLVERRRRGAYVRSYVRSYVHWASSRFTNAGTTSVAGP